MRLRVKDMLARWIAITYSVKLVWLWSVGPVSILVIDMTGPGGDNFCRAYVVLPLARTLTGICLCHRSPRVPSYMSNEMQSATNLDNAGNGGETKQVFGVP